MKRENKNFFRYDWPMVEYNALLLLISKLKKRGEIGIKKDRDWMKLYNPSENLIGEFF